MTDNKQYPPLPDFEEVEQHIYGTSRRYIPQGMLEPIHELMRAYVDADRAMRAGSQGDAEDAAHHRWLRDYFAAAALQGWLASFGVEADHPAVSRCSATVAHQAYVTADAMMTC